MLRFIFKNTSTQYSTKQQLYSLPSQNILVIHTDHCWRSKDEHISVIFFGPPQMDVSDSAESKVLYHLCTGTGCNIQDLPGAMEDMEGWRESEKSAL